MSIDMKSFSGDIEDSAAEGQQISSNSYLENANEGYPVHKELLDAPVETQGQPSLSQEAPLEQEPSKQELNFRALSQEVERIKAKSESDKREYELNLELLKANIGQQKYRQPEPEQPKRMFEGMEDGDIPNVSEIRRAWEQREADYQARIEELSVAQQYPDYAEVMQKHLTPLLQQKPHLAEGIQGARNKALFAYELGKMYQQQQTFTPPPPQVQPTQSSMAQRIVENSRKPGTLSGTGGTGSLSKAEYFATMSDKEFMDIATKHLGEI
jgi:hypothetical protein